MCELDYADPEEIRAAEAAEQDQADRIEGLLNHLLADVHALAPQVAEMHAELEEFRPLLRMFRPNGGASDLQRAGLLRAVRKAGRGG